MILVKGNFLKILEFWHTIIGLFFACEKLNNLEKYLKLTNEKKEEKDLNQM